MNLSALQPLLQAIVQDARRSGLGALNPAVEQRLLLIRPADLVKPGWKDWLGYLIASLILGAIMTWVMVKWVLG